MTPVAERVRKHRLKFRPALLFACGGACVECGSTVPDTLVLYRVGLGRGSRFVRTARNWTHVCALGRSVLAHERHLMCHACLLLPTSFPVTKAERRERVQALRAAQATQDLVERTPEELSAHIAACNALGLDTSRYVS